MKKILPDNVFDFLKKIKEKFRVRSFYKKDGSRYIKSSYMLSKVSTVENLRGEITFFYHSLEKGLSNENLRLNFGKRAYTKLFNAMDKFISLGYDTLDSRFQQAISVIEHYIVVHEENGVKPEHIILKYNEYKKYRVKNNFVGGATHYYKTELPDFEKISFNDLLKNRHSIRDYGEDEVPHDKINKAISLSMKAPSACNRHPWKVYHITNKEILNQIYQMQGGLTTNGKNLRGMLLVTANNSYFNGSHERNQTFIDGGMFAVTLLYALTAQQIATCPLHADFRYEKEQKVKSILSISDAEDLICFIAYGSYPEEGKYANSPRDEYSDIVKNI